VLLCEHVGACICKAVLRTEGALSRVVCVRLCQARSETWDLREPIGGRKQPRQEGRRKFSPTPRTSPRHEVGNRWAPGDRVGPDARIALRTHWKLIPAVEQPYWQDLRPMGGTLWRNRTQDEDKGCTDYSSSLTPDLSRIGNKQPCCFCRLCGSALLRPLWQAGPTTVLYCFVLLCAVLHCSVLYCTALCCTVLYCTVLCCTAL
jgi:hypothetical protein